MDLFQCCRRGEVEAVRLLLERGAAVDACDQDGRSPLQVAILGEHEALVELLLEAGADVNHVDRQGWTPLHHAARVCAGRVVDLLLERGADLQATNAIGLTVLQSLFRGVKPRRATATRAELARRLIERGADPTVISEDGGTLLHIAAQCGDVEVIALLLAGGAAVDAETERGATPLAAAIGGGHLEAVRVLLAAGANPSTDRVEWLVGAAAEEGRFELVEALQRAGARSPASLAEKTAFGAVKTRDLERLRSYLAAGGDPNAGGEFWTLLDEAASLEHRHLPSMRALLEAGADPNRPAALEALLEDAYREDDEDEYEGAEEALELLLGAGVDLEMMLEPKHEIPCPPLVFCARHGWPRTVDRLLAAGVDLEGRDKAGWTAAMWCARYGHLELLPRLGVVDPYEPPLRDLLLIGAAAKGDARRVRALLAQGADVRAADPRGTTALVAACSLGQVSCVELLLEAGADPEHTNWYGTSARKSRNPGIQALLAGRPSPAAATGDELLRAVMGGRPEIVAELLGRGAPVEATSATDGASVLAIAAGQGQVDVVKVLLAAGASPSRKDARGRLPLAWAAAAGQVECAHELLAAGASPDEVMEAACALGDENGVATLLAAGVDPDLSAPSRPPLVLAVGYGRLGAARALLDAGADPSFRMSDDANPALVSAVGAGREDLVALLLERGADPNLPAPPRRTPLMRAAETGRGEVVARLIAAGARVEPTLPGGESALWLAGDLGYLEVAQQLLVAAPIGEEDRSLLLACLRGDGAAVDCGLRTGGTAAALAGAGLVALHLAAAAGHVPVVKALLAAGSPVDPRDCRSRTPLMWAAVRRERDAAEALLSAGAAVDAVDDAGRTALLLAADAESDALVDAFADLARQPWSADAAVGILARPDRGAARPLLAAGADAEARMSDDQTALHLAAASGAAGLVEALLAAGADPNANDGEGRTPLMRAASARIVDCLVAAGAAVDARSGEGDTALALARQSGFDGVAAALLRHGAEEP